ncbi:hypothetical protein MMC22_004194 [Lobaria immixta]|nr:hypothetical protein [Lobaria immixta]
MAKRLSVFQIVYVDSPGPLNWPTVNERIIISNKTCQMPLRFVVSVFLRYRGHKGMDRNLIENFHDIQDAAEGQAFRTTRSLSRLPAAICCSNNVKDMGYEFRDIERKMDARRTVQTDENLIRLWNAESQAGRPLPVGQTSEGFPKTEHLSEDQISTQQLQESTATEIGF